MARRHQRQVENENSLSRAIEGRREPSMPVDGTRNHHGRLIMKNRFLTSLFAAFVANGVAIAAETAAKLPLYTETDVYKATAKAVEAPGARPSLAGGAGEFIVRPPAAPALELTLPQDGKPAVVANGMIRLTLAPDTFGGTVENLKTGISWSFNFADAAKVTGWKAEKTGTGISLVGVHPTLGTCTLSVTGLGPDILTLDWKAEKGWTGMQVGLQKDGKVFGGGERFLRSPQLNDLSLNPKELPMMPQDGGFAGVNKPIKGQSYCVSPWMFTPAGLGIFVDSFAVQNFTFSTTEQVAIPISDTACTVHLLAAETPKQLLTQYTGISGRTPIAPEWAYGVWGNLNNGRKNALDTLAQFRKDDIPVSAMWIFDCKEPHQVPHIGWWLWAKGVYGDVPSLNREIRAAGCKPMGYLLTLNWKPGFHQPPALEAWEEWLRKLLVEDGWNGWMEDFGENNPKWTLEYHKASHRMALKYCPDKVAFCRSGYAGSQAFTQVLWAGDQKQDWSADGYPSVVPAALSSGMSGFTTWTPDILEAPNLELFQRGTSIGAFSCVMREHQWNFVQRFHSTTDWRTLEHFRRYARLHNSLVPYITAQVKAAADTGIPVMRHLLVEFPADPKCQEIHDQYLFGDSLMVAPVLKQGAISRDVYFPAGTWYDFWTMARIEGGKTVTVNSPADHIPVFVKAGTILPMYPDTLQTLAADLSGNGRWKTPGNQLILRIFSGNPGDAATTLADGSHIAVGQHGADYTVNVKSTVERDWELQFSVPVNLAKLKLTGGELATAPQASSGFASVLTIKAKAFSLIAPTN